MSGTRDTAAAGIPSIAAHRRPAAAGVADLEPRSGGQRLPLSVEQAIAAYPAILRGVHAQRAFLARAVRYLAEEAGIRQFLDISTGLPAANNAHEVAQAADTSPSPARTPRSSPPVPRESRENH